MDNNYKLQIYKGMIQYLLTSTHYTMKNIADLCHSSIKNIRTIYYDDRVPITFNAELNLVKLYHLILELNKKEQNFTPQMDKERSDENIQY